MTEEEWIEWHKQGADLIFGGPSRNARLINLSKAPILRKEFSMAASKLGEAEAARYTDGKTKLSIVSPLAYWAVALDYTFGASKYDTHNWRKGMNWSDVMNSFERHYFAWKMGEDIDEESGIPHIFLALWNVMTLADYSLTAKQYDDRMKYPPEVLQFLRSQQKVVDQKVAEWKAKQKPEPKKRRAVVKAKKRKATTKK